ncbi:MAG: HD domain-containing protein [Candidatus Omnitrophica bacterium]|nr:HD domain-containing protein [Candidatus Omnitrophota bacterium]
MRLVRKVFMKRRPSHYNMLIQASRGMALITDVRKLVKLIAYIVNRYMKSRGVCIYLYNESKKSYELMGSRGSNTHLNGGVMETNNPLITWLEEKQATLVFNNLKNISDLLGLKEQIEYFHCAVCVPTFWKKQLLGFLILDKKKSGRSYKKIEIELLSMLSNHVAVAIENARNFTELNRLREREKESYFQIVLALAQTVDEKDTYTRGHLELVFLYGMSVAEELNRLSCFSENINMDDLKTALRLHDIGKIGIPDAILNKNGSLTPEEWSIMKQHCEIGARILEPIEKLKNVAVIVRYHQEKYDGTGYPEGLKGEEIPLESRIIAVVDAFHAMTSDRPYRKALSEEAALSELKNNAGTQFDPVVVAAFIRALEKGKIRKI